MQRKNESRTARVRHWVIGLVALVAWGGALHPGVVPAAKAAEDPGIEMLPGDAPLDGSPTHVLAMTSDHQGMVWMGTEGHGLYRFNPDGKTWTSFAAEDGLADDTVMSLACDTHGRIWAGTVRHGVSVFAPGAPQGKQWANYDVTRGPLGNHVFALAVSPAGDVWMGTDAGLARYSDKTRTWTYITHADGLPADQVDCLAFASNGDLYIGTQCDGIAIARAAEDYAKWESIRGVDEMPMVLRGAGLPTNLINALLVTRKGTVLAATTRGLAWSTDQGKTWGYARGRDWIENVQGSYVGPPPNWKPNAGAVLAEDWITSLAEDAEGMVWIGYREKGYQRMDLANNRVTLEEPAVVPPRGGSNLNYVTCLTANRDAHIYVGHYGAGASVSPLTVKAPDHQGDPGAASPAADFPAPAAPPDTPTLAAFKQKIAGLEKIKLVAAFLGDDWVTQGDWVGRYGRQYAGLSGLGLNTRTFSSEFNVFKAEYTTGPYFGAASAFTYTHSNNTDDGKSLWEPTTGKRAAAEVNDGGYEPKTFPRTAEGPDLWVKVTVGPGVHRVSLFCQSYDAQQGLNAYRDFVIELRLAGPAPAGVTSRTEELFAVDKQPALARARVSFMWNPVYKQFLVSEGSYWFTLRRNHSHAAKLCGVFVDRLEGEAAPGAMKNTNFWLAGQSFEPPEVDAPAGPAADLWNAVDQGWSRQGIEKWSAQGRVLAYRAAMGADAPADVLTRWRWQMGQWTADDRDKFTSLIHSTYEKFQTEHPEFGGG